MSENCGDDEMLVEVEYDPNAVDPLNNLLLKSEPDDNKTFGDTGVLRLTDLNSLLGPEPEDNNCDSDTGVLRLTNLKPEPEDNSDFGNSDTGVLRLTDLLVIEHSMLSYDGHRQNSLLGPEPENNNCDSDTGVLRLTNLNALLGPEPEDNTFHINDTGVVTDLNSILKPEPEDNKTFVNSDTGVLRLTDLDTLLSSDLSGYYCREEPNDCLENTSLGRTNIENTNHENTELDCGELTRSIINYQSATEPEYEEALSQPPSEHGLLEEWPECKVFLDLDHQPQIPTPSTDSPELTETASEEKLADRLKNKIASALGGVFVRAQLRNVLSTVTAQETPNGLIATDDSEQSGAQQEDGGPATEGNQIKMVMRGRSIHLSMVKPSVKVPDVGLRFPCALCPARFYSTKDRDRHVSLVHLPRCSYVTAEDAYVGDDGKLRLESAEKRKKRHQEFEFCEVEKMKGPFKKNGEPYKRRPGRPTKEETRLRREASKSTEQKENEEKEEKARSNRIALREKRLREKALVALKELSCRKGRR